MKSNFARQEKKTIGIKIRIKRNCAKLLFTADEKFICFPFQFGGGTQENCSTHKSVMCHQQHKTSSSFTVARKQEKK